MKLQQGQIWQKEITFIVLRNESNNHLNTSTPLIGQEEKLWVSKKNFAPYKGASWWMHPMNSFGSRVVKFREINYVSFHWYSFQQSAKKLCFVVRANLGKK